MTRLTVSQQHRALWLAMAQLLSTAGITILDPTRVRIWGFRALGGRDSQWRNCSSTAGDATLHPAGVSHLQDSAPP